ncbi:MAG: response regulator [Anaerolineaceae bacterium]|jgi:DNA-binding response OmpR family regulator
MAKILIVDDDLETLRLVGLMLQRQGYEISAANSGSQALGLARSESPDLIVLDIMMPEMDGLQFSQRVRKDPAIAAIPILMFTAKSQVDDKVAGYEAGADDYLTKPVHPAELVAHIKALMARTQNRPSPLPVVQRGYSVGVIASKGGLGVSTLTLNLAASYARKTKTEVIAAEIRSGQGTWGLELGFSPSDALDSILQLSPADITPEEVEKHLVSTSFGVRLLLSNSKSVNQTFTGQPEKIIALINALTLLSPMTFIDVGTPYQPGYEKICSVCRELIVVTEPLAPTVSRTKELLYELRSGAVASGKIINLVLINRTREGELLNSVQVSDLLDNEAVTLMIPPSPEQTTQAIQKKTPLVNIHTDGLVANQIGELAGIIKSHAE